MGLDVITGKHFEELMLRIQDGVKQEERASFCEESDTFHLVFIAGVARGLAEAGCRIEHEAVVNADRFHGSAARENSLATAAVTAKVMMNDRARQNDMVDVAEVLIDPNRCSARSRTEVLEVFLLIAEAVVHLQTRSNILAHSFDHFFFGHRAVRAEREDNVHIFVFDAELIHLVDENRHKVEAVCDACRVIADEGNLLARFDGVFVHLDRCAAVLQVIALLDGLQR